MGSRTDELRAQHRKVLWWALAVAAVLHVGFFALLPGLRSDATWSATSELEGVEMVDGAPVDVRFGPPRITAPDGTIAQEPPDRRLQVVRLMRLPADCDVLRSASETPIRASVSLRVDPGGYARAVEVAESTGHTCADQVVMRLAGDLQYHWLPSERFPAPVELVQPVTLVEAVDE